MGGSPITKKNRNKIVMGVDYFYCVPSNDTLYINQAIMDACKLEGKGWDLTVLIRERQA